MVMYFPGVYRIFYLFITPMLINYWEIDFLCLSKYFAKHFDICRFLERDSRATEQLWTLHHWVRVLIYIRFTEILSICFWLSFYVCNVLWFDIISEDNIPFKSLCLSLLLTKLVFICVHVCVRVCVLYKVWFVSLK